MGRANSLEKTLNQEDKGTTEDEMVGWNHWLSGHEFEQTSGDNEGQGILVCYSPWVCSSDTTELLNNNSWFSVVFVSGVPTDSKVTQLHMYLFLFKFFSLLGCYIIAELPVLHSRSRFVVYVYLILPVYSPFCSSCEYLYHHLSLPLEPVSSCPFHLFSLLSSPFSPTHRCQ